MSRPPVTDVAVVVPVHDEEELLAGCLERVLASMSLLGLARPGVRSSLWVVLDDCTDGSARVVAGVPAAQPVLVSDARVGAARAAGVRAALGIGTDPHRLWIANTDADSKVPTHWLVQQVLLADAGADAVIGTVVPDSQLPAEDRRAWQLLHELGEDHPHQHGANLGVRGSAYLLSGGFPDVATGEDGALITALHAVSACCVATDSTRVTTSSRLTGRAPAGFAAYLAALALTQTQTQTRCQATQVSCHTSPASARPTTPSAASFSRVASMASAAAEENTR